MASPQWQIPAALPSVCPPRDSAALSRAILHCASRGLTRTAFLHEVCCALLDCSGCAAAEVRLHDGDLHYRWEVSRRPRDAARLELVRWLHAADGRVIPATNEDSDLERVCRSVATGEFDPRLRCFNRNGSFWTGDAWEPVSVAADVGMKAERLCIGGHYRSLAVLRFLVDARTVGLLLLKDERPHFFTAADIEFFEGAAQTLGLAIADRRAEYALRERIKELTCLYGIARVAEQVHLPLEQMLGQIVELLPPAWQFPELAAARIELDGRVYRTAHHRSGPYVQTAPIVVGGRQRGTVEVVYLEEHPEFSTGVFLKEEQTLIQAVAREVALLVERREAEQDRHNLQQQLIHADRLATIGQLAAGVAHELNEPLGSILGFAQLMQTTTDLPAAARRDLQKIVNAALYAREVIRKLLVFGRQMPARKTAVDLNQLVHDGLHLLEARCARSGITLVKRLASDLPPILADPAQITQVLVNLTVNAMQAMPAGGTLTVTTAKTDGRVLLAVEDTGTGIDPDVLPKIFLPFFTTKDISEGTGLGLAVVHGIVAEHGGTIDVRSSPGQGTCFSVCLPAAGTSTTASEPTHA